MDAYDHFLDKEFKEGFNKLSSYEDDTWIPQMKTKHELGDNINASTLREMIPKPQNTIDLINILEENCFKLILNTAQKKVNKEKIEDNYQCNYFIPPIVPGHIVNPEKAAKALQTRLITRHKGVKVDIHKTEDEYFFLHISWFPELYEDPKDLNVAKSNFVNDDLKPKSKIIKIKKSKS